MSRKKKWLAWLVGIGLLALALFGSIPVSRPDDNGTDFDMQVVLGGNTRERSDVSYNLWKRHRTPILVTGDNDLIRNELLRLGVPREDIHHEEAARNTWQNAENSKPILESRKARKVVIVTSWFHTSRARDCFARVMAGIDFATCSDPKPNPPSWVDRKVVAIERLKKLMYWVTRAIRPW